MFTTKQNALAYREIRTSAHSRWLIELFCCKQMGSDVSNQKIQITAATNLGRQWKFKRTENYFQFCKKEKKKTFPEFFRYQKPFFNGIGPLKVSAIDLLLLLQVPSKCLLREFDCLHLYLPPSIFFLSLFFTICLSFSQSLSLSFSLYLTHTPFNTLSFLLSSHFKSFSPF